MRGYCVDCKMIVGSRLGATGYGCGANENPQRVEDTLWMGASETRLLW